MSDETIEVRTRIRRTRILRMGQNRSQTDGSLVAAIRISGIYLHDLGFDPKGFFKMTIQDDGSLLISPSKNGVVTEDEVTNDDQAQA
jgi:hypothetical protein